MVEPLRKIIVIAATRKDGCVGYFKDLASVPPEFEWPGEEDIEHIYKSMGRGLPDDQRLTWVLDGMNSHWKTPSAWEKFEVKNG